MIKDKGYKSISEQIRILKQKGLIIDDEVNAKKILFKENYFFLTGYKHCLIGKGKRYIKGATFSELYSIFTFDRNFRNICFKNILIIENNLKSIFSHALSKKYGSKDTDYLKTEHFVRDEIKANQVRDVLNKIKRQIRVNGKKHSATAHYLENYGYIPMWVLIKVLSFGMIAEFYDIFKIEEQFTISNYYKVDLDEFSVYLDLLANYRNLCAHEDIVYDNKTMIKIRKTNYHNYFNIKIIDNICEKGGNDIFALILILKQMLGKDQFTLFLREIDYEINKLESRLSSISINVILNKMGIPYNYIDLLDLS